MMRALRSVVFALALPVAGVASMTLPSVAQAQAAAPTVTGVMVMITVKPGVTRKQVMAVMPAEIKQTVELYLDGKIHDWYSRGDNRGVVLILNVRDVAEAQAIMNGLPLTKENIMDYEYIPVGPLLPLRLLVANPERQQ